MSTRCQVTVIAENAPDEAITLYHHTDGYPSYMVPCIAHAYALYRETDSRISPRAGIAASWLCAADPGTFEIEAGRPKHGDLAFAYEIYLGESPRDEWEIAEIMHYRMDRQPLSQALATTPTDEWCYETPEQVRARYASIAEQTGAEVSTDI